MTIHRLIAACLIANLGMVVNAHAQVQPIDQLKVISAELADMKARLDAYVASQVPVVNQAPVVSTGSNQTITLPASTTLNGTATDDGLPAGSTLTRTWSKVSGPGTVTFGNANAQITTASLSVAGAYILRLTVSDSVLTGTDDVGVTVNPALTNLAPVVSAGPDQAITLPTTSVGLTGTATDDGLPAPTANLTYAWTVVSGPASVTFSAPSALVTTATFTTAGFYVLRLTASDSALSAYDAVGINVSVAAASSCSGVIVPPTTTNLQAVVNAQPEGTTFCFQPGTYRLTSPVLAKSRDRFMGQPGAVLDGQGTVTRGIWGYGGLTGNRDVTVSGIEFKNFTDSAVVQGWYWTVSGNNMHHNRIGATVNSYSTLDGNAINDNTQYGINGGPGNNILVVNNEIARNNTSRDCGGACVANAGGTKIVGSTAGMTGLIFRGNKVHDNIGPGLWCDGNCRGTIYEGNEVSNNSSIGIFDEISWDAKIRNNTLTDNATDSIGKSCWWSANIYIGTSSNAEVSGNTITASNGSNAVCIVSADRSEAPPYSTTASNNYIHNNDIHMTGTARTGFVKGAAAPVGNRFVSNRYFVPDTTKAWWTWPMTPTTTWTVWQAAGQDKDGTLNKK